MFIITLSLRKRLVSQFLKIYTKSKSNKHTSLAQYCIFPWRCGVSRNRLTNSMHIKGKCICIHESLSTYLHVRTISEQNAIFAEILNCISSCWEIDPRIAFEGIFWWMSFIFTAWAPGGCLLPLGGVPKPQ